MAFIEWKDSFATEIPSIDEQHKKLVELINLFHQKLFKKITKEELSEIFSQLRDYTIYHFQHEEKLMEQCRYGNLSQHKIEHKQLVNQVISLEQKLNVNDTQYLLDLADFLKNWLLKHIMGSDKKYAPTMIENEIK